MTLATLVTERLETARLGNRGCLGGQVNLVPSKIRQRDVDLTKQLAAGELAILTEMELGLFFSAAAIQQSRCAWVSLRQRL
jgi:hypothetical protein